MRFKNFFKNGDDFLMTVAIGGLGYFIGLTFLCERVGSTLGVFPIEQTKTERLLLVGITLLMIVYIIIVTLVKRLENNQ